MFTKKSVVQVLASFNKMVSDLEAIEDAQLKEAARRRQKADEADAAAKAALDEVKYAASVKQKLLGIINP